MGVGSRAVVALHPFHNNFFAGDPKQVRILKRAGEARTL
jgi:hypothetical protein